MRLYLRKLRSGIKNNQKGVVLPMVLSYSLIFALEAAGLALYAGSTLMQVQSQENHMRNFYIAEAATEKALSDVRQFMATQGRPPTQTELNSMSENVPNVFPAFQYIPPDPTYPMQQIGITYPGAASSQVLSSGSYAGLTGLVQTIEIEATASNVIGRHATTVTMAQEVQIQLIPVFQFGVFYENDLEIHPGPDMDFVGPVHANGDIYLGGHNTLTFDSGITSFGDIYHGRKAAGSSVSGDIMIKDGSGTDQNMNLGSEWLDSSHADWLLDSQTTWNGNVKSWEHGTQYLTVPLPTGSDPHTIIERRDGSDSAELVDQKMDYKAHIRIIDGVTMNAAGTPIDLRYCVDGAGNVIGGADPDNCAAVAGTQVDPISTSQFKNWRENKTIVSTDIDVGLLNDSPTFQLLATATANGIIIYHSEAANEGSSTYQDALRLVNGSEIYTGGMTVVSEEPAYVQGDYNLDDPTTTGVNEKRPAGIVSDAFNILSNNWDDANSWSSSLSSRTASHTTVNAAIISGNTDSTDSVYSGGFENIHRFHETWSGQTLTYRGSVTILFNSEDATGDWIYGSPYYQAPTRNWGFDTDLSDPTYVVPGFPSVYQVVKSDWDMI